MSKISTAAFWMERAKDKLAEHLVTIIFIAVYTAILGWSAWMEQNVIPVFYIVIGIAAGLCFVLVGIAYCRGLLYNFTAKDKLRFGGLNFAIKTETDAKARGKESAKPYISGIRVGFTLTNAAHFPITVSVDSVATRLDGKCPIDKDGKPIQHKHMEVTIAPMGMVLLMTSLFQWIRQRA